MAVSDSQPAVSDHVVIQCPACGAAEAADAEVLAGAPMIVCRNCGETWPAAPRRKRRALPRLGPAPEPPHDPVAVPAPARTGRDLIEAERRPLVTYSAGVEKAWAAKMEGDVLPELRTRSRVPLTAAAAAALFFVSVFLGGREAAVASLPDLAGLYASVGLPVNLAGLAIEGVVAERTLSGETARLVVRGTIRNVAEAPRMVPPLSLALREGGMPAAASRVFAAPVASLAAGATAPFLLEVAAVPRQAGEIVLRFRRPAEPLPAAQVGDEAEEGAQRDR